MSKMILLLPGDGVGPEICRQAGKVLDALRGYGLDVELQTALIGGAAFEAHGEPLPEGTLAAAGAADAVLLGAVGGPAYDALPRAQRPETALLQLRSALDLFANLRPARLYPELADVSTLKPEIVGGLDIMIVRELTGGLYFGQPRGIDTDADGVRRGYNTMVYAEPEIERIVRVACEAARRRDGRVCSVDKANVLEVSALWREVAERVAADYADITLSHMYVDNAAMQLVRAPRQFDVIVTGNLFGDILSDAAAMLTGSIGMLPSASLDAHGKGLYEPVHGSAPDIAGQDKANPLATLLSVAMLLRHSLGQQALADRLERAVGTVLAAGLRTVDIAAPGERAVGTEAMGDAVVDALIHG